MSSRSVSNSESELLAIQRLRRFLYGQGGDRQEQLDMLLKWLKKFSSNDQIIELASQLQTTAATAGRK